MNAPPGSFVAIDEAVSSERDRCAAIAEQHAIKFERKRLYASARAMRNIAKAIQNENGYEAAGFSGALADSRGDSIQ